MLHTSLQTLVHGKRKQSMNHELPPKSINNKSGFTMIELLVVIAVIGILTSIGISTYAGIQAKGRDTKRRGDIDEIRKAMELYYVGGTSTPYQAPTGNMFSDGIIPKDPKSIIPYIYYFNGAGLPGSGSFANYVICAKLEAKGGNALDQNGTVDSSSNGDFYCKKNAQ